MPSRSGFDLNFVNYAPVTVGTAILLFGAWYALSARRWFRGPVRVGTDEGLELQEVKREEHPPTAAQNRQHFGDRSWGQVPGFSPCNGLSFRADAGSPSASYGDL